WRIPTKTKSSQVDRRPPPDPPRPSPFTFRKKISAKLSWPIGAPRRLRSAPATIRHKPQRYRLCRRREVIRPNRLAISPPARTQQKNTPHAILPATGHFSSKAKAK